MKPTCVPIRPFWYLSPDGRECGWLFALEPPWQSEKWARPVSVIIVHHDFLGIGGIRVCKAMYTGTDREMDWGVGLPRREARQILERYWDEIHTVMDLGRKP